MGGIAALLALSISVFSLNPLLEDHMLNIKPGVRLNGLQVPMAIGVQVVASVFDTFGEDCWITATTDGEHKAGSLHYAGLAVDFRTRHLNPSLKEQIVQAVKQALGPEFDVVVHSTHLHVEYDVRSVA